MNTAQILFCLDFMIREAASMKDFLIWADSFPENEKEEREQAYTFVKGAWLNIGPQSADYTNGFVDGYRWGLDEVNKLLEERTDNEKAE